MLPKGGGSRLLDVLIVLLRHERPAGISLPIVGSPEGMQKRGSEVFLGLEEKEGALFC